MRSPFANLIEALTAAASLAAAAVSGCSAQTSSDAPPSAAATQRPSTADAPPSMFPDLAKIDLVHYQVGRWTFEPVFGKDNKISMIVGWSSSSTDRSNTLGGATYSAVVFVRGPECWSDALGKRPKDVAAGEHWLRAYWRPGQEFFGALEAIATEPGSAMLRQSRLWSVLSRHKKTDDAPTASGRALEGDPISDIVQHPAKVPVFAERDEGDQAPPAWNPAKDACEKAARPMLSEKVFFDKLVFVFETVAKGTVSVPDPDPCMLVCPGQVGLTCKRTVWTSSRRETDAQGKAMCVYTAPPSVVWYCDWQPLPGIRSSPSELRGTATGGTCPPMADVPAEPFLLRYGIPGQPSQCPIPTTETQPSPH